MTSHKLIPTDAAQNCVHERPLWCSDRPSSFGFRRRKSNGPGPPDVTVQFAVLNENPAPDDLARLAHALDRSTTQREVHRRLAFAHCVRIAICEMIWRNRTRDLEHPNKLLVAVDREILAVAHVVKCRLRCKPQLAPNAVRDQCIQASTFIRLVEVGKGKVLVENALAGDIHDRGPVDIVQKSFREIGSWADVFQSLLILNADGIAAELVCHAERSVVHAHATFVENTHDGFVTFELAANISAEGFRGRRQGRRCERSNVASIMDYRFAI